MTPQTSRLTGKQKLAASIGAAAVAVVVPLVSFYEGTILRTYRDPIGIITACTGHVDSTLRMGTTYTREQCEDMLVNDLLKHAKDLDCVKQPLGPNQKAALLSFTFNVGGQSFCSSTLVRKINAGMTPLEYCPELSRWTLAGGKQLPGLVKRRQAERELCETP